MVCARGIRVVWRELEKIGLTVHDVRLGAVTVAHAADELDWQRIREALAEAGFDLLADPEYAMVAQVKRTVNELLRRPNAIRHRDFVPTLTQAVGLSMRQLHRLFIQLPDQESLLGYITHQRLAYAQQLLAASQWDVGRIARQLGYNSLAHFSGQFRRFMHCAPSVYRQQLHAVEEAANSKAATPNDAS